MSLKVVLVTDEGSFPLCGYMGVKSPELSPAEIVQLTVSALDVWLTHSATSLALEQGIGQHRSTASENKADGFVEFGVQIPILGGVPEPSLPPPVG